MLEDYFYLVCTSMDGTTSSLSMNSARVPHYERPPTWTVVVVLQETLSTENCKPSSFVLRHKLLECGLRREKDSSCLASGHS